MGKTCAKALAYLCCFSSSTSNFNSFTSHKVQGVEEGEDFVVSSS